MMRFRAKHGIGLTAIALLLIALQAGIWQRSVSHTASETVKIDRESDHPPTEIPFLGGITLLVVAGVLLSWPHAGE